MRQADLDFVMIEKTDRVGDSWHRHYDRLHLHTVKELSHLPGLEFPDHYPRYVPRKELADYYQQYASAFSIEPLLGEEARKVRRSEERWVTTTGTGLEIISDNVVIATGLNHAPTRPHYPGEESFEGRLVHSREYHSPGPFLGERVLVVGMGNTGAEIALDLSEAGVDTAISVRGPVNIVPRDVLGRPTQLTARMLARLPVGLGDRIGTLVRRLTVGDLSRFGIATPEIAPLAQLRERGKTPVIDVGTVAAIKRGRIAVRPAIERLEADRVVFTDGREERYDTVILATGYRPMLEQLLGDTPGILDRPAGERNAIEQRALAAVRHLGDIVLFLFDPTETASQPMEAQQRLLEEVRLIFGKGRLVVEAENKVDKVRSDTPRLKLSATTGEGVEPLVKHLGSLLPDRSGRPAWASEEE